MFLGWLPGVEEMLGVSSYAAWRVVDGGRAWPSWGFGLTGYAAMGLSGNGMDATGVNPAVIMALPLGERLVLRASGGPVLFSGNSGWSYESGLGRVMRGASGFLPFAPNVELVWRVGDGQELTLGGYPNLVGWRLAM
jgi:hypothetical protein